MLFIYLFISFYFTLLLHIQLFATDKDSTSYLPLLMFFEDSPLEDV